MATATESSDPKFSIESRQSVTRLSAPEWAGRLASVGHGPEMRGCNTMNPATSAVAGFVVGHFGGVLCGYRFSLKNLNILLNRCLRVE